MTSVTGSKDNKPKMSVARTLHRMAEHFNKNADEQLKKLDQTLEKDKVYMAIQKKLKEKDDKKPLTQKEKEANEKYIEQRKEISSKRIRFSAKSSWVIAALLSKVTYDFLSRAMDTTFDGSKKVVKSDHIFYNKSNPCEDRIVDDLPLYPLFSQSNVISDKICLLEKRRQEKEDKKNGDVDDAEEVETEKKDAVTADTFKTYVKTIYDSIKTNGGDKYSSLRISDEIKQFLSAVNKEIIDRLCISFDTLIKLQKVKTIDPKIVVAAVRIMMGDCGKTMEVIDGVIMPIVGCDSELIFTLKTPKTDKVNDGDDEEKEKEKDKDE
jgi:hypothetical protein